MKGTEISSRGDELFDQARRDLSRFVHSQARAFQEFLGFGWTPDPKAPNEYGILRRAYVASSLSGQPLPVSDEHSVHTIYDSPVTNYAFRFWHDVVHVRLGQGFDLDGEIAVATSHLDVLHAAGWGPGTVEFALLHADTLGQTLCAATTGSFPEDQACFARRSAISSLGEAIRGELQAAAIDQGKGR